MAEKRLPPGAIDTVLFDRNRDNQPWEVLQPYVGRHVAWSADGTRILASAGDLTELIAVLDKAGIGTQEVVFDYIDDGSVSNL
jgi:hypothetical protein